MQKHIFIKDGKVVSVSSVNEGSVSCTIEGAELHLSDQDFQVGMSVEVVDGVLTQVPSAPEAPKVSPVQFKLLFTSPERIAIKASTDPVVQDFFDIVNDPRLTHVDLGLQSTQDALSYLVLQGLLTTERRAEILLGEVQ
jgi:hypothetical protein